MDGGRGDRRYKCQVACRSQNSSDNTASIYSAEAPHNNTPARRPQTKPRKTKTTRRPKDHGIARDLRYVTTWPSSRAPQSPSFRIKRWVLGATLSHWSITSHYKYWGQFYLAASLPLIPTIRHQCTGLAAGADGRGWKGEGRNIQDVRIMRYHLLCKPKRSGAQKGKIMQGIELGISGRPAIRSVNAARGDQVARTCPGF